MGSPLLGDETMYLNSSIRMSPIATHPIIQFKAVLSDYEPQESELEETLAWQEYWDWVTGADDDNVCRDTG